MCLLENDHLSIGFWYRREQNHGHHGHPPIPIAYSTSRWKLDDQLDFFSQQEAPLGLFSNKDPHHDGLLCHYGCYALENQPTPPQDPLRKGLAEGAIEAY